MSTFNVDDHYSYYAGGISTPSSCITTPFESTAYSDISDSTQNLSNSTNALFPPYHEPYVASSPYHQPPYPDPWADQLSLTCNVYPSGLYGAGIGSWVDSSSGVPSNPNDSLYAMPLSHWSIPTQIKNGVKDYHSVHADSTGIGVHTFADSFVSGQQRPFSQEPSAVIGSLPQPRPLMKRIEQYSKPKFLPDQLENALYAGQVLPPSISVGQNLDGTTNPCDDYGQSGLTIVPSYPALPELSAAPELDRMSVNFVVHPTMHLGENAFPCTPSSLAYKHFRPLSNVVSHHEMVPDISCETLETSRSPAEVPPIHCNTASKNKTKDELLLEYKAAGMSYKEIKAKGGFEEAESTLRGRFRTLTKAKDERVRKPEWTDRDISILKQTVSQYLPKVSGTHSSRHGARAQRHAINKVPWKQVAEIMANRGCYHYGNATVKKKYLEVSA